MRKFRQTSLFDRTALLAGAGAIGVALFCRAVLTLNWTISALVAVNAITFLAYLNDKAAARRGAMRVPEATLHWLAALGGSPAAFAAQQILRHKTAKRSFQIRFWGIVVAQALLIGYLTRCA